MRSQYYWRYEEFYSDFDDFWFYLIKLKSDRNIDSTEKVIDHILQMQGIR